MSGVQRQGCITRSTASREVEEDVEKALEGATVSCQQQVLFHEEKLKKGDGSSVGRESAQWLRKYHHIRQVLPNA